MPHAALFSADRYSVYRLDYLIIHFKVTGFIFEEFFCKKNTTVMDCTLRLIQRHKVRGVDPHLRCYFLNDSPPMILSAQFSLLVFLKLDKKYKQPCSQTVCGHKFLWILEYRERASRTS